MKKVILMKFTSRSRPEQLLKTLRAYVDLANNTRDMVWLFSLDEDDPTATYELNKEIFNIINTSSFNVNIFHKPSLNKIHAINRDIDKFQLHWDILLNISDDQLPIIEGYDDIIRESMPDHLDASLWFSDGHQDRINTQEILGLNYFNRTGKIYNDQYASFFCDNEATEVAMKLGKMKKYDACIIRHFHPQWDSSKTILPDALYKRNDSYWNHDQEVYNKRKRLNFDIC